MLDTIFKGLVRGTTEKHRSVAVGGQGQQLMAKLLPDFAQLVAEGRVWRAQEASATASVVALPTTAALFTLGNNEPDDGLWYVPLAIYGFNSANAAAIDNFTASLSETLSQVAPRIERRPTRWWRPAPHRRLRATAGRSTTAGHQAVRCAPAARRSPSAAARTASTV